ncbi:MAG: ABC transporter ATP-binding protein [Lachnospiraceae bacterium]|nr:ABC transporter ATP-binding protein [Lachnospiraceae bacterium]
MNSERFSSNKSMIMYFLEGSKRYFAGSVVFACLSSLFDLINPRIIGFTVDSVLGTEPVAFTGIILRLINAAGGADRLRTRLWFIALVVVIIAAVGAVFRYLHRLLNSTAAETLVRNTRNRLFEHIEKLPFAWYMQHQTGDIIQRCTSDVETVKRFLAEQLTGMIRIVMMLSLSLFFMSRISVPLTICAAVFIPVIIMYSVFFHSKISAIFRHADEEEGKLSAIAQENLTGVRVIRAFGRERYEKKRFAEQNDVYTGAFMKLALFMSGFWSLGDMFSGLQVLAVVAFGAVLTVRGSMTTGNYIAFISYNSMLVWPVRSLGRVISEMSKAGVSVSRLKEIMNAEPEYDDPDATCPSLSQDIEFSHVTYGYTEEVPEMLKDVSFTIHAGETFGILGGTGSGKSTLMYLLDRLYELPEGSGKITIGGTDIRKIKRSHLRGGIGMVLQEPYLFSRTLSENIAITQKEVSMDKVRRAARIADLDDTVNDFTAGYDTYVGERGVTLSGGQKQRAAIAQTILRDTPIMIFDDSLSAVDAETDARIRARLRENTDNTTVILISHRITTLMHADQIMVLSGGRVEEIGDHETLYNNGGTYRRLCDIQTAGLDMKTAGLEFQTAGAEG